MKYEIMLQFANPEVKFDEKVRQAIKAAIETYNSKGLIARNPKSIVQHSFSEDLRTMKVILESENVLPTPHRALRFFSTILVKEPFIEPYLAGKQLFKTRAVEFIDDDELSTADTVDGVELLEKVMSRAATLIKQGDTAPIYEFLKED